MRYILCAAYHDAIRLGKDDSGVAFVLTLGVFMLMFMLCCGVYAIGDTVRQKIELQNAADAAAYSAAVVQADTLSRIATINRAMAWTYVQMTRRQMDFIVDKWLERTLQIWEEDFSAVKEWNMRSQFGSCPRGHKGRQQPDTYWVGIGPTQHGIIHFNGIFTGLSDHIPGLSLFQNIPVGKYLGQGFNERISTIEQKRASFIAHREASLQSGNKIAISSDLGYQILFDKLNINAMNFAEMDLVIKMPSRIEKTVHGILKANLPEELIKDDYFNYYLYQNNLPYSYFRLLNNTKEDEEIFVSFADYYTPQKYNKLHILFSKSDPKYDPAGYVQGKELENYISGGLDHWFVRGDGSKRTDGEIGIQRSYKLWAEDVLSSIHPSKYLPFIPPSCMNLSEHGENRFPSIGLYSEWKWYSMIWICVPTPTPWNPTKHRHESIISKFWCNHCSLDIKIKNGNNCIVFPQEGKQTGKGFPVMHGYTRVYGDDEMILAQHKEKYIGAKCLPLILSPAFFGKPGSLVVGVSRKNRNPWSMIMDACGIFKAFEPGVSHMWAVSATRAGYRKVDGGVGEYHLEWTDPSNNRERWNLKQPDWDAVFLPVRDAWKLCAWDMFVPGIFSGDDKILEELMTSSWAGEQGWNNLKPPAGMHAPGERIDWKELSKKLTH